jgi:hypothetical protein
MSFSGRKPADGIQALVRGLLSNLGIEAPAATADRAQWGATCAASRDLVSACDERAVSLPGSVCDSLRRGRRTTVISLS